MTQKLLEEVASQFGNSKPVFKATLHYNDTSVDFSVKDQYRPAPASYCDPVAKVIAKRYQEALQRDHFVQCTHLPTVYSDITESIIAFYEAHAPLKNPRQSRLYKWLKAMENRYNHPSAEGFIGLYRYIHGVHACSAEDTQNVIAILEMMREKYEDAN